MAISLIQIVWLWVEPDMVMDELFLTIFKSHWLASDAEGLYGHGLSSVWYGRIIPDHNIYK